jgi:hypothetical protein
VQRVNLPTLEQAPETIDEQKIGEEQQYQTIGKSLKSRDGEHELGLG